MTVLLLLALGLRYPTAPNASLTPGVTRPELSKQQICHTTWGADRRAVTEAMKDQVAHAYGIPRVQIVASGRGPCCEFDHFISRELGGADDVRNLWPQPWAAAHLKDVDENRLHRAVCANPPLMTLEQARDELRRKWGPK